MFKIFFAAGCSATPSNIPPVGRGGEPPNLDSLVFWVSNGLEPYGIACRKYR